MDKLHLGRADFNHIEGLQSHRFFDCLTVDFGLGKSSHIAQIIAVRPFADRGRGLSYEKAFHHNIRGSIFSDLGEFLVSSTSPSPPDRNDSTPVFSPPST